jgi:16S rRNA (cytosine1402-N4)-methyltransferase
VMSSKASRHVSVLCKEVVESFSYPGMFLDLTFGGGGHSKAILVAHHKNVVFAVDRDLHAIGRGQGLIQEFSGRLDVVKGKFSHVGSFVGGRQFDGVIADLGMSTDQLKGQRGFSFMDDTELDMRMDVDAELTAAEVLNHYAKSDLYRVMRDGGIGPRVIRPLVEGIVRGRPYRTTGEIVDVIKKVIRRDKDQGGHPATVVFQALRMEVNQELAELRTVLAALPGLVKPQGRIAIIAFHSLEDKEVARVMRVWAQGSTVPARLRTGAEQRPIGRLLTRKAIVPTEEETEQNPASRSARMRVFEMEEAPGA